jgi:uncharacterized protein YbjT (DUF2867 family)
MVGQGVLRECLADPEVTKVLSVSRTPTGVRNDKLREIVHQDFLNFAPIAHELAGFNACFFCLGISSFGMPEQQYYRITYEFTLAAAQTLAAVNPAMTFIYVSGQGTSSDEQRGPMWARVKGKTENALLRLPFKAAYMFRPGVIQPLHGIRSKTAAYRILYAITAPLLPALRSLFPKYITTTELIGRAMINVAKTGAPQTILEKTILENPDINRAALQA